MVWEGTWIATVFMLRPVTNGRRRIRLTVNTTTNRPQQRSLLCAARCTLTRNCVRYQVAPKGSIGRLARRPRRSAGFNPAAQHAEPAGDVSPAGFLLSQPGVQVTRLSCSSIFLNLARRILPPGRMLAARGFLNSTIVASGRPQLRRPYEQ